jgi:acetyltransferase-like isoleucine patch superfamily enzyme/dTDP-4-dehydrorhamnose 3,5-epimerase-like enzyme
MLSELADVRCRDIGDNTSIGPFATVAATARIGANCSIGSHCSIGENVVLEDGVIIESGVRVGDGTIVMNGAHIEANVTISPIRAGDQASQPSTIIEKNSWIGANVSIAAGLTIGESARILAGSSIVMSVSPNAIVQAPAAAVIGYVDAQPEGASAPAAKPSAFSVEISPVADVRIFNFPVVLDPRGNLTVGEFDRQIPFKPLRYFIISNVPDREVRGEHAHHKCHQFLICIRGTCAVIADDGRMRQEVLLDTPSKGIYLPPMTWGTQYKYSPDAVLLVYASDYYDSADYIRSYAEFRKLAAERWSAQS